MPSSVMQVHSGLGVIAGILLLGLLASPLTLLASTWLLSRYRRAVVRFMAADAGAPADAPPALPTGSGIFHSGAPAYRLYRDMLEGPRRLAMGYALAGFAFALLVGVPAYFAFAQLQVNALQAAAHPLQLWFLVWSCAWPVVLTVHVVGAPVLRERLWLVAGYFAMLVLSGGWLASTATEAALHLGNVAIPAWSGESPLRLAGKWSLFNLLPTLLLLLFRHRRVRAVAPLVLGFMCVVSAGVLGTLAAAAGYWQAAVAAISHVLGVGELAAFIGYFAVVLLLACVLFGSVGWYLLLRLRAAYLRKAVSDQSLAVDALWLMFAANDAVVLAFAGPGWALAPLLAFAAFKAIAGAWQKRGAAARRPAPQGPALLVLRVFSLGRRSEALFEAITRHWRHIGRVQLIAGADLALSTVAPHRFLAFVSGRLRPLFIGGQPALERGLAELDVAPDADGRYRINDFFCHADTWQSVLSRLVAGTDVVLMDLRNFAPGNAGCVYEIQMLLRVFPVARLVVVVDDTTDRGFLTQTLDDAWRALPAASPNAGLSPAALQWFWLRGRRSAGIRQLLQRLSAGAVAATPPAA